MLVGVGPTLTLGDVSLVVVSDVPSRPWLAWLEDPYQMRHSRRLCQIVIAPMPTAQTPKTMLVTVPDEEDEIDVGEAGLEPA